MHVTELETKVLAALRSNTEGSDVKDANGDTWSSVYLDNAVPDGVSAHSFAGVLGSLQQKGLYRPIDDGCFGDVNMTKTL